MKLTSLQIPLALWLSMRLWDERWWYLKTLETHWAWLLRKSLSTVLQLRQGTELENPDGQFFQPKTMLLEGLRSHLFQEGSVPWRPLIERRDYSWVSPTGVAVSHSSPFFIATKSDDSKEDILKILLSSSLQFRSLPEIPKKQFNVFSWS